MLDGILPLLRSFELLRIDEVSIQIIPDCSNGPPVIRMVARQISGIAHGHVQRARKLLGNVGVMFITPHVVVALTCIIVLQLRTAVRAVKPPYPVRPAACHIRQHLISRRLCPEQFVCSEKSTGVILRALRNRFTRPRYFVRCVDAGAVGFFRLYAARERLTRQLRVGQLRRQRELRQAVEAIPVQPVLGIPPAVIGFIAQVRPLVTAVGFADKSAKPAGLQRAVLLIYCQGQRCLCLVFASCTELLQYLI